MCRITNWRHVDTHGKNMYQNTNRSGFGYLLCSLIVFLLLAGPALAWEYKPGSICELTHENAEAQVRITYDVAISEYAIAITLNRPWSRQPVFAIRFDGPRGMTISTDRHLLSDDRKTLAVKDRGFGNVLNGIEFNETATAVSGDDAVVIALDGAGPHVRAFRACANGLGV